LVGIGETGLDFAEVGQEWQTSQAELFRKFIGLARELDKPLVIHSRAAYQQAIEILEEQRARRVLMHLFGARHLLRRVVDNGWSISVGPIALRSKTHKKIIRDTPLERLLLETDSPWFGPGGERNEPTAVRAVAERVARIKKLDITEVDKATTANAIKFFQLPL
jgi:TatD DNase family protein